jgi:hypothetical protein
MDGCIKYISSFDDFKRALFSALEAPVDSEVLISGAWGHTMYSGMISSIIGGGNMNKCSIIIPNILNHGTLSRQVINKIVRLGGRVCINSSFTNNFVIIDRQVFVVSFTSKYDRDSGITSTFEGCLRAHSRDAADEIRMLFMDKWNKSLPLIAEDIQEEKA